MDILYNIIMKKREKHILDNQNGAIKDAEKDETANPAEACHSFP